jgi:hypothetical protein
MSEPVTSNAPSRPSGRENVFTHKIGPLPMWAWVAIIGGGLVAYRIYSNKQATAAASTTATTADQTNANQVPQFVNQTYVSTGAPTAAGTMAPQGTPAGPMAGGVPTNPSPVSTVPSTQPKPTTTTPTSWSYPAPSGLAAQNQGKGVYLTWNAVTGPAGQHPNSYNVATYNSAGKLVSQHSTTAGNNQTAEYGPGGKGLPKGVYHTNVWANGGPVAPPHATVQYTLSS